MKSFRGKGKKPLGNEGGKTDVLQAPNAGTEEDDEHMTEDEDGIAIETEDPPPIVLNSRLPYVYGVLKDILAERRGNWFSGFARNFKRNNRKGWRWLFNVVTGVVAGGAVAVVTGDPALALAAGAAGMGVPTAASTVHVRNSRLDARRRDYPDMPEFRDDWAVASYELMVMIGGFNLRVKAIARLRRMAEEVDDEDKSDAMAATADAMAGLLWEWRQELIDVAGLLASYQNEEMESVLTDIQTIAIIRNLSPLKDGRYDWLCLDPEIIPAGHEQEFHERDLREIACHQDVVDAIDPYSEEVIRRKLELERELKEYEEKLRAEQERRKPKKKDDSDG